MKTCPKCNGKYFDDDTLCSDCGIELMDNKEHNKILEELEIMSPEERRKHKFDKRYRMVYKYEYSDSSDYNIPTTSNIKNNDSIQQSVKPDVNIPKCPTCGSTNVKKITLLNRAVSIGMLGLLSGKIGKNYECKDCGSKW